MKKHKNKKIQNSVPSPEIVQNGLSDVIMSGINPLSAGTQLSQTDSLFTNVRNYLVSNMRQILSQIYVEHGMIQAVVDTPIDDAFRGGFDVKTSQLEEDDLKKLKSHMEANDDFETIKQAFKWSRLYGGGGIVAITGQKHDTVLDRRQSQLKGLEFRAVDMWELFSSQQNIDDDTRKLEIKDNKDFCFNYYAINLNNTRVIVLKGKVAPAFIRPRLRGWGVSVVESIIQSVNQFLKTKNLTFEVLDEFKIDIFKVDGFNTTLMSKGGTEKIIARTTLANQQKNFQKALTIDAADDFLSKQLNFSGISEIMKDIRIQLASDLKMPMTKLFGLSASGFNSGEDDIEVYNGMLESEVRSKAKKPCLEVVKLRCAELFGFEPDDLEIEFKPLRVLSLTQEEEVKEKRFNRVMAAIEKGICTPLEAKQAINRDNLLPIKIEETEEALIQEPTQTSEENANP